MALCLPDLPFDLMQVEIQVLEQVKSRLKGRYYGSDLLSSDAVDQTLCCIATFIVLKAG